MVSLKPALTIDEQIDRLKTAHNVTINNIEEAKSILSKVNYYRLSGYGIGLKQKNDKEKYNDGITLEMLYGIYNFDSGLRNILTPVIEQIEIQFRAKLAYHLAIKYGSEGYMDISNFESKKFKDGTVIHTSIIEKFKQEADRQKNIPYVKHHFDKYEGHFPVWVAVELFTFGNLTSTYNIMKKEDRTEVADLYDTSPRHLDSWMLSLVEIRNICAHYGRLYNMPLKQQPYLYVENKRFKQCKKVFPVLLTIKRMLKDDIDLWNEFYDNLVELMDKYVDIINISFMDFPRDWKTVLK